MIIFDTETTGLLDPEIQALDKQPEIIEFAAIKISDSDYEVIERIEFLVKPRIPVQPHITKITSITNKQLQDCQPFAAHIPALCEFFLGERTLIAHNLDFDRRMLEVELKRAGKALQFPWPFRHLCTVEETIHLNNHRMKLKDLHRELTGDEFEGAHRAMVDTEALLRVVEVLLERQIIMP